MLDERPQAVAEGARHRHLLVRDLGHAERGVAVHLVDDLLDIAERKLPDRVGEHADRLAAQVLVTLVHRLERVAHRAVLEELRLAEIRIPAGALDPAAHHVAPARHAIDVAWRISSDQRENLVAHRRGASLVGIEAEDPVACALRDRLVAQVAEALERDLHHPRAERGGALRRAVGAAGIGHHDLVGPEHARHRGVDLLGFVVGDDIGGDGRHRRRFREVAANYPAVSTFPRTIPTPFVAAGKLG